MLDAAEALLEAELVFQPIHQAYYDREASYTELVAARMPIDAAREAWLWADDRENSLTLPAWLPPGPMIYDVWAL